MGTSADGCILQLGTQYTHPCCNAIRRPPPCRSRVRDGGLAAIVLAGLIGASIARRFAASLRSVIAVLDNVQDVERALVSVTSSADQTEQGTALTANERRASPNWPRASGRTRRSRRSRRRNRRGLRHRSSSTSSPLRW
jgi:hypothetical protein